jgi:ribosomal protein L14
MPEAAAQEVTSTGVPASRRSRNPADIADATSGGVTCALISSIDASASVSAVVVTQHEPVVSDDGDGVFVAWVQHAAVLPLAVGVVVVTRAPI